MIKKVEKGENKMTKERKIFIIALILIIVVSAIAGWIIILNIKNNETVETFAITNYAQSDVQNNNIDVIEIDTNQVENNVTSENNTTTEKNEISNSTDSKNTTENTTKPTKTTETKKETVTVPISKNRKIDPSKPMVAITFDDGPGKATTQILNTLEKYGVVATFFDLGQNMVNNPKIVKREESIGCEVECHTYAHKNLNTLSESQIQDDIAKAEKTFKNILGHKPYLVRPPYGNANAKVKNAIKYPLINWDIDTLDWKSRNANSVLAEIRKYKDYNGRIILMHGIYNSTAEAVETLVPELIEKGYQLVTVSEMAKYKGVTLKTGTVYLNFR